MVKKWIDFSGIVFDNKKRLRNQRKIKGTPDDSPELEVTMEKEEKKDITIADVAEALGVSKTTDFTRNIRKGKNRERDPQEGHGIHRGARL